MGAAMPSKHRVYVHDVAVRDGFQIEERFVPTDQKIAIVNRLSRTGLAKIEVTSFVSPHAVPALSDADTVMRAIDRVPGVVYSALAPNKRGFERALACQVDEINWVMSASITHGLANLRMTADQSLRELARVLDATPPVRPMINVALSTAFGCPFDGEVPSSRVLQIVDGLLTLGVDGLALCDTTGMANPLQVAQLCEAVIANAPSLQLTVHFHNTRGMGLANALAALNVGVVRFDASLGGLGGCPFAPGATGNVCTEDLVHMFEAMGCNTGVDLSELLDISRSLPAIVGHDVPGQVAKAGPSGRVYPKPSDLQRFDLDSALKQAVAQGFLSGP
jgi:hydroxymethylglutaryl-CoA lyase